MSPAEQLRDAVAAYRVAVDRGDAESIRAARREHVRVVGEILAAKASDPSEPDRRRP